MANRIKGITVEIGGDTTGLDKALRTSILPSRKRKSALQHQLKQLTRKERTHRLCTRGGMLESFLQEPKRLTDDDVMLLLKLIFHRQDTQELLKKNAGTGEAGNPLVY